MATASPADESAPDAVAAALHDAPFVRVCASADGDALAAAGLLARALREKGIPFQIHTRLDLAAAGSDHRPDDDLTLALGSDPSGADAVLGQGVTPASVEAARVATDLGTDPDPVLALAGTVAAGATPGARESDWLLQDATSRGLVVRRPGVAVPTADLADGLAHSTLLHAPFSGDTDRVQSRLAGLDLPTSLDDEAHRRVASLVALETAGAESATPRAAEALERALRPHETPDGPFATLGGYADVLGALARDRPGAGVALALGGDDGTRGAALTAWRAHATAAHAVLRHGATERYEGVYVVRSDDGDGDETTASDGGDDDGIGASAPGRLATAARLLRDFRSAAPVALVLADGAAAAAGTEDAPDLGRACGRAAETLREDGDEAATGGGRTRAGEARFEVDPSAFLAAFRGAL